MPDLGGTAATKRASVGLRTRTAKATSISRLVLALFVFRWRVPIPVFLAAWPRRSETCPQCITDGAAVLYRGLCRTPTVCLLSLARNLYWNRLMFLII